MDHIRSQFGMMSSFSARRIETVIGRPGSSPRFSPIVDQANPFAEARERGSGYGYQGRPLYSPYSGSGFGYPVASYPADRTSEDWSPRAEYPIEPSG
jgi:hypothetical protein